MRNYESRKSVAVNAVFALVIALLALFADVQTAMAQEKLWIQVESHQNIRDTRARARVYAAQFPSTRAFATSTGWYAIVLGPFDREQAESRLLSLKSERRVPRDAFVYDGNSYQSQLWPLSANIGNGDGDAADPAANTAGTTTETTPAPPLIRIIAENDLNATRRFERSWSRERKMEYQRYLTWTNDYDAAIDGAYGPGTRAAIRSFQAREGYEATGYLSAGQTLVLRQRYREMTDPLGIAMLESEEAGLAMLYPARLLERDRVEPPFVYYRAAREQDVRMVLISQEGDGDKLRSLYEIMETFDYVPPEGYRSLKRGWFVLSGDDGRTVSYTYARLDQGLIKGFSLIWAKSLDPVMKHLVTQMYESFRPLPELVLDETIGYGDDPDEPTDLSDGLNFEKPALSGSGFYVNAKGVLITNTANIANCKRITAGDGIEMREIARDPSGELVLLRPVAAYTPPNHALFSASQQVAGAEITVAGFSFPEVMEVATLNYGTLAGSETEDAVLTTLPDSEIQLSAFIEPGDFGGPVLDDRGAVIGMQMQKKPLADAPEFVNFALKSDRITAFLKQQGVDYGLSRVMAPLDAVDIAMMAGEFTAKVSCWR